MELRTYRSTSLLLLYGIIATINLIGNSLDFSILVYCSKPLLMLTLVWFYWQNRSLEQHSRFQQLIVAGLIFAFLGDVFLLFEGKSYFLLGLSCFFVTHVLYTIAFFIRLSTPKVTHLFVVIPFVIYYAWMSHFLSGQLSSDFRLPVLAYSTIITIMAIIGGLFSFRLPAPKSYYLLAGIILFVISDTCIAFDQFTDLVIPFPRFSIMSTYILAQLGIVLATVVKDRITSD